MSAIYEVVGTFADRKLLADPAGADQIAVPLKPGSGKITRGEILYRDSSGLFVPAASGQISASYYLVVANEDADTGDSVDADSVPVNAAAFRAGCFVDGAVKLASNGTVTEAHKVVLRAQGIVFSKDMTADPVDNSVYHITYKANNAADPAEDDVVKAELAGATHTVLGNSGSGGTGFTAPATKSFSKWNTKADGTGTDYAAAASYTAIADLTLYAVWA